MAKLEDVCEILDSKRVPITASNRQPGPYPYYGANGIQDYVADYIFDDELVLLAEDGGNFGSKEKPIAYRVSGKCWVNNHAHVLKPKAGLDVDYLCYSLMFYDVTGLVNGATRQKLNQADMRKMEIPLPSLDEQRRIAAVLDKVSDLIAKRREQLRKLDELVKARFVEMFGDPETNPKGYEIRKLGTLAKKISDGVHAKPDYTEIGRPFLSVVNINKGVINFNDCKFISEEAYQKMIKSTHPERGDILYTKVGATYGIPAYVDTDTEFCLYVSVCLIKPKHDEINSKFLALSMGMFYVKRQADRRIKGIGVPDLHLNQICEFDIVCPPRAEQEVFVSFSEQIDESKLTIQQSLDKLEVLKKALMQQYFGWGSTNEQRWKVI